MSLRAGLATLVAIVALAGVACSSSQGEGPGDGSASCAAGFLGDAGSPPQFDFIVIGADGNVALLSDGDTVPLVEPLQGGRVIYVGVRATNVDGCGLQLKGVLRDEASGKIVLDMRTINLIPEDGGWAASGTASAPVAANFANVAVCPNGWSSTDVFGHSYVLEVTLQDRAGRTLTRDIHVTPECSDPPGVTDCLCICKAGYVLGETCAIDAGAEAGGAD